MYELLATTSNLIKYGNKIQAIIVFFHIPNVMDIITILCFKQTHRDWTACIANSDTFFNSDGQSEKCDTVTITLGKENKNSGTMKKWNKALFPPFSSSYMSL